MALPTREMPLGPQHDHNMTKVVEDDQENTSCFTCKLLFTTRTKYLVHNKRHTKAGKLNTSSHHRSLKINPNVIPEWDDPDGYCKSCKKKHKTINIYKTHLKRYHMAKHPRPAPTQR